MADPTGYVNFADFLGLNDEAGKSMLDSQMSELERLRQAREAASDARFTAAKHGADAYAASGERERAALSSYGDFMKKMNDPKGRMELMEQTYGKGRVSALDAALAGAGSGAARIRDAQKGFEDAQHDAESRGIRDEGRAKHYQSQIEGYAQQEKDYAAEQAAKRARLSGIRETNKNREDWRAYNYETWKRTGGDANRPYAGLGPAPDQDFRVTTGGWGGIDPETKKPYTVAKAKTLRGQYGWGGAGTLRDAAGGGDY